MKITKTLKFNMLDWTNKKIADKVILGTRLIKNTQEDEKGNDEIIIFLWNSEGEFISAVNENFSPYIDDVARAINHFFEINELQFNQYNFDRIIDQDWDELNQPLIDIILTYILG